MSKLITKLIHISVVYLISSSLLASSPDVIRGYKLAYSMAVSQDKKSAIESIDVINKQVESDFDVSSEEFKNGPLGKIYESTNNFKRVQSAFNSCQNSNKKYTYYTKTTKNPNRRRGSRRTVNDPKFDIRKYQNRILNSSLLSQVETVENIETCNDRGQEVLGNENLKDLLRVVDASNVSARTAKQIEFQKAFIKQNIDDSVYSYLHFTRLLDDKKRDATEEELIEKFCGGQTALTYKREAKYQKYHYGTSMYAGYTPPVYYTVPDKTTKRCSKDQIESLKSSYKKNIGKLNKKDVSYIGADEARVQLNRGIAKLNAHVSVLNNIKYPDSMKNPARGTSYHAQKKRDTFRNALWQNYENEYNDLMASPVGALLQSEYLKGEDYANVKIKRSRKASFFSSRKWGEMWDGKSRIEPHNMISKNPKKGKDFVSRAIMDAKSKIISNAQSMYDMNNKVDYDLENNLHKSEGKFKERRVEELKDLFQANPGALGRLLAKDSSYAWIACEVSVALAEEADKSDFWDKVWIGAGFIAGGVLILSVAGSGAGALTLSMTAASVGATAGGVIHDHQQMNEAKRDSENTVKAIFSKTGDKDSFKDLEKLNAEVKSRLFGWRTAAILGPLDFLGIGQSIKVVRNLRNWNKLTKGIEDANLLNKTRLLRQANKGLFGNGLLGRFLGDMAQADEITKAKFFAALKKWDGKPATMEKAFSELRPELAKIGGKGKENYQKIAKIIGPLDDTNRELYVKLLANPSGIKVFAKTHARVTGLKNFTDIERNSIYEFYDDASDRFVDAVTGERYHTNPDAVPRSELPSIGTSAGEIKAFQKNAAREANSYTALAGSEIVNIVKKSRNAALKEKSLLELLSSKGINVSDPMKIRVVENNGNNLVIKEHIHGANIQELKKSLDHKKFAKVQESYNDARKEIDRIFKENDINAELDTNSLLFVDGKWKLDWVDMNLGQKVDIDTPFWTKYYERIKGTLKNENPATANRSEWKAKMTDEESFDYLRTQFKYFNGEDFSVPKDGDFKKALYELKEKIRTEGSVDYKVEDLYDGPNLKDEFLYYKKVEIDSNGLGTYSDQVDPKSLEEGSTILVYDKSGNKRLISRISNKELTISKLLSMRDPPPPPGATDKTFTYYTKTLVEPNGGKHQFRVRTYVRSIDPKEMSSGVKVEGFDKAGSSHQFIKNQDGTIAYKKVKKSKEPNVNDEILEEKIFKDDQAMLDEFDGNLEFYAPHGKNFKLEVKSRDARGVEIPGYEKMAGQVFVQKLDIKLTEQEVFDLFNSVKPIEEIKASLLAAGKNDPERVEAILSLMNESVKKEENFRTLAGATEYQRYAFGISTTDEVAGQPVILQTTMDFDMGIRDVLNAEGELLTPTELMSGANSLRRPEDSTESFHVELKSPRDLVERSASNPDKVSEGTLTAMGNFHDKNPTQQGKWFYIDKNKVRLSKDIERQLSRAGVLKSDDYHLWDNWGHYDDSTKTYHRFSLAAPKNLSPDERHFQSHIKHFTSKDGVNWADEGAVVWPRFSNDVDTIWSGSTHFDSVQKEWTLYFTGTKKDDGLTQKIWSVSTKDHKTWSEPKLLLDPTDTKLKISLEEKSYKLGDEDDIISAFRDPYREDDTIYFATKAADETGQVRPVIGRIEDGTGEIIVKDPIFLDLPYSVTQVELPNIIKRDGQEFLMVTVSNQGQVKGIKPDKFESSVLLYQKKNSGNYELIETNMINNEHNIYSASAIRNAPDGELNVFTFWHESAEQGLSLPAKPINLDTVIDLSRVEDLASKGDLVVKPETIPVRFMGDSGAFPLKNSDPSSVYVGVSNTPPLGQHYYLIAGQKRFDGRLMFFKKGAANEFKNSAIGHKGVLFKLDVGADKVDEIEKIIDDFVGKKSLICINPTCKILDQAGIKVGRPVASYNPATVAQDLLNSNIMIDGKAITKEQVQILQTADEEIQHFIERAKLGGKAHMAVMTVGPFSVIATPIGTYLVLKDRKEKLEEVDK